MTRWHGWVRLLIASCTVSGCSSAESATRARNERSRELTAAAGAPAQAVSARGQPAAAASDVPTKRDVPLMPRASSSTTSAVCARDRYTAEQTPLTIYTLFDESLSMLVWWGPVTEAFTAFVRDPGSAGINIGLKFFGTECSPDAYSVPDVAIGPLPGNAETIGDGCEQRHRRRR